MELRYKINSRVLLMAMLGAIMACSSYLMLVYDPLQLIIKKLVTFAPGSLYTNMWANPPYDVFINIYIFNVSNSQDFLDGKAKLAFNQVGPYVYKETLLNQNATFSDDGTVSFNPRRYLDFVRELSVGDSNVDRLITPNIPLIGITSSLNGASMFTNLAVSTISSVLGSKSFLNITVAEYLWGYDDRLVTLANEAIPSWINFQRFGIMDRLMALDNASNTVILNLDPKLGHANSLLTEEEQNYQYHIKRFNGSPGLKQWGYVDQEGNNTGAPDNSRCNLVEGSFEGTVYPPNMKDNSTFKLYRRAFCRPVPMNFESRSLSNEGFDAVNFRVDQLFLATPEENPENACYCYQGKCLRKGLGSLSPCYYDIPVVISQPHFLNADPELLEQFDGIKPDKDLHDTVLAMHANLSIPLSAKLRIQINLDVGKTKYNARTRPFNDLVLPLFWLELRISDIPTSVYLILLLFYHVLPVAQTVLIVLLGIFGVLCISGSAFTLLFYSRNKPPNNRLSFKTDYAPIPILPFTRQYFQPDIRICK